MKCAMEAVALAAINKAKIEAAEQGRISAIPAKSHKDTLAFIEEVISPEIDARAAAGRTPYASVELGYFEDSGYTFLGRLVPERFNGEIVQYANGKISQVVSRKLMISLPLLEQELAKYCYKVSTYKGRFMTYGLGEREGIYLRVEPAPQCVQ